MTLIQNLQPFVKDRNQDMNGYARVKMPDDVLLGC